MNNILNSKSLIAGVAVAGIMIFSGCKKEQIATTASPEPFHKKVSLNADQQRAVEDMYAKMPKLRYWDEAHHRFIELSNGSRDLVFTDPDEGFTFNDPDENGVIVLSDASGDYLVLSSGFGVNGNGGGGVVVAGSSQLLIDVAICISAEAVAAGDGYGSLFDAGFGFSEYAAVFGISGDFEALSEADTESEDFNPFDYLHGFAAYYVLSDDITGEHEVFDWLSSDGTEDFDDLASSYVMDFSDFSLYFATGGTITVSGGTMTFDGEYIGLLEIFESFLDGEWDEDEAEVDVVSGYGSMGCN